MLLSSASESHLSFTWVDWAVIAAYLLMTTLVGARLSGKQSTIREFFLGGRKLPWWAICGSIIATEISAVTFIGAPARSFAEGGNLTYMQLGIGAIIARLIIGYFLVSRYYEKSIYSPYDYMGKQLGSRVKSVTTLLFFIGAVLGQGARVFVTAFVLKSVTGFDFVTSIWLIGLFSVGWTLMGGMTTVIWTDVIQFCVLVFGAIVALFFAVNAVPGGFSQTIEMAQQSPSKFQVFNFSTDPSLNYTIWTGLLAMPFLNLAALGVDQVMAQRMFCCKNERHARWAVIWSSAGQLMALLMLFVGIGLYAWHQNTPLSQEQTSVLNQDDTYILPIFIVHELPIGVRGLIVAAIFAAAISSLDSALAALSQSSVSAFKSVIRAFARKLKIKTGWMNSDIRLSKIMVVVWGLVLCAMATACIGIREYYEDAITLALSLSAYTYGALLGIFLLALLPVNRDDAGLPWAVAMAILAVFGLSVHDAHIHVPGIDLSLNWADWVVWIGAAVFLCMALVQSQGSLRRVGVFVGGALAIVFLHHYQVGIENGEAIYPSPYWGYPIGTVMTFAVGYGLGRPTKP